jgi:hypothetical protein
MGTPPLSRRLLRVSKAHGLLRHQQYYNSSKVSHRAFSTRTGSSGNRGNKSSKIKHVHLNYEVCIVTTNNKISGIFHRMTIFLFIYRMTEYKDGAKNACPQT